MSTIIVCTYVYTLVYVQRQAHTYYSVHAEVRGLPQESFLTWFEKGSFHCSSVAYASQLPPAATSSQAFSCLHFSSLNRSPGIVED